MSLDLNRASIRLAPNEPLILRDARGARLRNLRGTAWLTVDHEPADRVLEPGDEVVLDSPRRAWISPLGAEAVTLELVMPCRRDPTRWLEQAAQWGRRHLHRLAATAPSAAGAAASHGVIAIAAPGASAPTQQCA